MKQLAMPVLLLLVVSNCFAAEECHDAEGNILDQSHCTSVSNAPTAGGTGLPADAMAQVNDLKAKMRYFKAIGFHKQSKDKRDEIAAIYAQHGVPLPDEFKE